MKIYTSYFANRLKLQNAGIISVSIALYPPRWFRGIITKYVSPTYDILHNTSTEEEYTKRFNSEILNHRDPKKFIQSLEQTARGKDIALCCFEMPNEFCHRHLVAKWMNEQLGLDIEEYGISKNPVYEEQSLF